MSRPISYEFDESIPLATRQKIRTAIAMWENKTCIRFSENGYNIDRIEFFDGGGCSSFVGKTGGTQVFDMIQFFTIFSFLWEEMALIYSSGYINFTRMR